MHTRARGARRHRRVRRRGGGSPTVAQGGGLSADPDEVVAFLRE